MIKYTTQFLTKLEELIAESDYMMRYEKGNFKSGYCLLKEQKIMIVNKFFVTEGKINALLDILKNVELDTSNFSEKNLKLYEELTQAEVKLWWNLIWFPVPGFPKAVSFSQAESFRSCLRRDVPRVADVPRNAAKKPP